MLVRGSLLSLTFNHVQQGELKSSIFPVFRRRSELCSRTAACCAAERGVHGRRRVVKVTST